MVACSMRYATRTRPSALPYLSFIFRPGSLRPGQCVLGCGECTHGDPSLTPRVQEHWTQSITHAIDSKPKRAQASTDRLPLGVPHFWAMNAANEVSRMRYQVRHMLTKLMVNAPLATNHIDVLKLHLSNFGPSSWNRDAHVS